VRRTVAAAVVVAIATASLPAARAEAPGPWYRGFYTQVGIRRSFGVQEVFHVWTGVPLGLGHRLDRGDWGVDCLVLNLQLDPGEGQQTAVRLLPYRELGQRSWLGAGLSYGWNSGTVDRALSARRGHGLQAELAAGVELPRQLRLRLFVQATLTAPLYELRDVYRSHDSRLYVYSLDASLGVRL
jgi:hypothetical protein